MCSTERELAQGVALSDVRVAPPNTRHQSPYQPASPLPQVSLHLLPRPAPSPTTPTHDNDHRNDQGLFSAVPVCTDPATLITLPLRQMSATQKVQQHPAFIQAQDKANYYVNQLDKEGRPYMLPARVRARRWGPSTPADHTTAPASSPSTPP